MSDARQDAAAVVLASILAFMFSVVVGMSGDFEPWATLLTFVFLQLLFALSQVVLGHTRRAKLAVWVAIIVAVVIAVNLRIG
jgi:hypothetical protein